MSSFFFVNVNDSSWIPVKEAKKQRKEAKLINRLEKQKQKEAAEKAETELSQSKKGNNIILLIFPM